LAAAEKAKAQTAKAVAAAEKLKARACADPSSQECKDATKVLERAQLAQKDATKELEKAQLAKKVADANYAAAQADSANSASGASDDDDDGFPVLAVVVPLVLLCIVGVAVAAFLVMNGSSKEHLEQQQKTFEMRDPSGGFSNPMYHNPGGDDDGNGDLYDDAAAYGDTTGGYADLPGAVGVGGDGGNDGYADFAANTAPGAGDYDNGDFEGEGDATYQVPGEGMHDEPAFAAPADDGGYMAVGATENNVDEMDDSEFEESSDDDQSDGDGEDDEEEGYMAVSAAPTADEGAYAGYGGLGDGAATDEFGGFEDAGN